MISFGILDKIACDLFCCRRELVCQRFGRVLKVPWPHGRHRAGRHAGGLHLHHRPIPSAHPPQRGRRGDLGAGLVPVPVPPPPRPPGLQPRPHGDHSQGGRRKSLFLRKGLRRVPSSCVFLPYFLFTQLVRYFSVKQNDLTAPCVCFERSVDQAVFFIAFFCAPIACKCCLGGFICLRNDVTVFQYFCFDAVFSSYLVQAQPALGPRRGYRQSKAARDSQSGVCLSSLPPSC